MKGIDMNMWLPGPMELIVIMVVGIFAYLLPLLFAVFVIVYLVKIRNAVEALRQKLDQKNG
jgi:hypothetical protein